jgi:hypothetical protein
MNCSRKNEDKESCAGGVQSRRPLQLERKEEDENLDHRPRK